MVLFATNWYKYACNSLSMCHGKREGTTFGPINQEARNVYEYNG